MNGRDAHKDDSSDRNRGQIAVVVHEVQLLLSAAAVAAAATAVAAVVCR